jgi:CubicO group peptidase (beta-lactamase class C family)/peptidoglycan/LPS O-acetylase OafA/YrhL
MFALTGNLLAASTLRTDKPVQVVRTRLLRLCTVFWPFAAVVVAAGVLLDGTSWVLRPSGMAWLFPVTSPPGFAAEGGWVTAPLWYIRTYLHCLLLWPVSWWLLRRYPRLLIAAHLAALFVLHMAAPDRWRAIHELVLFNGFLVAGAVAGCAPAVLERGIWRRTAALAALAAAAVVWWQTPPASGAVNDVALLHALIGIATLAAVLELRSRAFTRLQLPARVERVSAFFATRSLTVYLWHAPLYALFVHLAQRVVPNVAVGMIAVGAAVAMFVTLPALAVFEQRRWWSDRTVLRPSRRYAPIALPVAAFAALTMVTTSSISTAHALPRIPSKAPTRVSFTEADSVLLATVPAPAAVTPSTTPSTHGAAPSTQHPAVVDRRTKTATPSVASAAATADPARIRQAVLALDRFAANEGTVEFYIRFADGSTMGFAAAPDTTTHPTPVSNRFDIYSVTKSFTAALLLRAVVDGRLDLDAPIGSLRSAPTFPVPPTLTVRHLLYHRSGLANYADADVLAAGSGDTLAAVLDAVGRTPLRFAPGTRQVYSSTNFIIAGLVVADVYDAPVETVLRRDLFAPLGLDDTEVYPFQRNAPGTGTGNMRASAQDLLRWGTLMWGTKTVLDSAGNKLASVFEPASLMGPGSFAYCPCAKTATGATSVAARGMNGVDLTLRVYTAGVTVVLRTPGRQLTPAADRVLTEMVATLLTAG